MRSSRLFLCQAAAAGAAAAAADGSSSSSSSGSSSTASSSQQQLPTRALYDTMTNEQLTSLLRTRDEQIGQLRSVYEHFHYEVDKRHRTMIFDYHDKAIHLSHVHGVMQMNSVQINREALVRMRERDEAANRDKKLTFTICIVATFVYWLWLRRHYAPVDEDEDTRLVRSVYGAGSGDNPFGSTRRNARSWDTPYEKSIRQKQQQQAAAAAAAAAGEQPATQTALQAARV